MIAIRTVLCPVDFSAATDRQIDLAGDLCRAFGARLVVHHNLLSAGAGASVGWMWTASHPPHSEREVEQQLGTLLSRLPPEVETEARITHGPASSTVLALADSIDADLLILATHGATSDDHTSVTEQVLEHGRRAVLALHEAAEDAHTPSFAGSSGGRQVVLVPTDLSPEAQAAVDLAFDLARRLPVDLHLLHLLGHATKGDVVRAEDAHQRLTNLVPEDLAGRVALHVEGGEAADGIASVAARLSASCIIMGEHTRAPVRRWFSHDTSRAVLHRAPCPVWYVPGRRAA